MAVTIHSTFSVPVTTDLMVILIDLDEGRSVTNDAENVILWLDEHIEDGLKQRKVFYRDTHGDFDELMHVNGLFTGFHACSKEHRQSLAVIVEQAGL